MVVQKRQRNLLILLMPILTFCLFVEGGVAPGNRKRPDPLRAEKMTVTRMNRIMLVINTHRLETRRDFATLSEYREYGLQPEDLRDGWGRGFFYFTTGTKYVLVSFGRAGAPSVQLTGEPAELRPCADDEANNIVIIDGEWAQAPCGVALQ